MCVYANANEKGRQYFCDVVSSIIMCGVTYKRVVFNFQNVTKSF